MENKTIYSYLMEDKTNNIYKIGRSKDPVNRLKNIKTANPYVKLIGVSFIEEKYLHQLYFKYRIVGEWFSFPDKIKNEVFELFKPTIKTSKVGRPKLKELENMEAEDIFTLLHESHASLEYSYGYSTTRIRQSIAKLFPDRVCNAVAVKKFISFLVDNEFLIKRKEGRSTYYSAKKGVAVKTVKIKNHRLRNYYMNKFVILEYEKDYQGILDLSEKIFNKIGVGNFKNLLKEDEEFCRITTSAIYMSL